MIQDKNPIIRVIRFDWKGYIESKPDLRKNWNGPIRARLHHYSFRAFLLFKSFFEKRINDLKLNFSKVYYKNRYAGKLSQNIKISSKMKDDISVIFGVKDKPSYFLENSLKSLRNQTYSKDLIKIILIDYNSENNNAKSYEELCKKYQAEYIRIDNIIAWNRAHCLNIGIKKAKTKYILISDTDIIFKKNYILEGIKELKKNPMQVVICSMLDAPGGLIREGIDIVKMYEYIKSRCILRCDLYECYDFLYGQSINMALTAFYELIRGHDEKYLAWGCEDKDLIKRFNLLGIKTKIIDDRTSHVHQHHVKYWNFDTKSEGFNKQLAKNRAYFKSNNTVVRNRTSWGEI